MASINISIKKEAYDFLSRLKTKDRSFSDVILEFKGNKDNIMKLFGALGDADIDWEAKEKRMKEFRDSFNKKISDTSKCMREK